MRKYVFLLVTLFMFVVQMYNVNAANPDGHICEHGYYTFSDYHMGMELDSMEKTPDIITQKDLIQHT